MKTKVLIFSLLLCFYRTGQSQDYGPYIRSYEDVAVAEMFRTGIPASIKLAQACLESNGGTSELARKANNHFGIKCGGDWTGSGFHKEDDDYKDGQLTKSCFRQFNSADESFIAHSDFLTDPKKIQRYGPLFQLPVTDYKSWARGLAKAGYATDPKYADKLIDIIEKNKLYLLDSGTADMAVATSSRASLGYTLHRYNNDVKYILARDGENLRGIAEQNLLSVKDLERYNDHLYAAGQKLDKGTRVYLEAKRTRFHGRQRYYVLRPGEDLPFVAQEYGIKLASLRKRNGLTGNEVPAPGQKIMLRGKSKTPLRTADPYQLPETPGTIREDSASTGNTPEPAPLQPASAISKHVVSRGETLYSIAQSYGLSVSELKKRNNLSADTIFIGQTLCVQ